MNFVVGHMYARGGLTLFCNEYGTANVFDSFDEALLKARYLNYTNNVGRTSSTQYDVWSVYALGEIK